MIETHTNLLNHKVMNREEFEKRMEQFFDEWSSKGCMFAIIELIAEKKIATPIQAVAEGQTLDDAFDKCWDDVEEKLEERLDKAMGGDWIEVGKQAGFTEEELETLYVDVYQGKTDAFEWYWNIMKEAGAED